MLGIQKRKPKYEESTKQMHIYCWLNIQRGHSSLLAHLSSMMYGALALLCNVLGTETLNRLLWFSEVRPPDRLNLTVTNNKYSSVMLSVTERMKFGFY